MESVFDIIMIEGEVLESVFIIIMIKNDLVEDGKRFHYNYDRR